MEDHLSDLDKLNPKDFIIIKGARMHNLKNISVAIPRNQLIVVTGLSGSGKSSLVLDTLFVEAQRMYMESISTYARQFLGKLQKPLVDTIQGLSPAIAINQHVSNHNPRSTIGTLTELCDYLYLLYARIGITYSPISGAKVKKDSVSDVVDYIQQQPNGTKVWILYPIAIADESTLLQKLKIEQGKGFIRVMQNHKLFYIDDLLKSNASLSLDQPIYGLADRIIVTQGDQANQYRIADSAQIAFFEGMGHVLIVCLGLGQQSFSDRFERDGITFTLPSVSFFSFNTPNGACKICSGLGQLTCIDPTKVIPIPSLSVMEGAIAPWNSPIFSKWLAPLLAIHEDLRFPIYVPYNQLTPIQQNLLWKGDGDFRGIDRFFEFCASQTEKIQYRVLLSRYRTKTICPDCRGTRFRSDAHYVKIQNHSIVDLLLMPIETLISFFDTLFLTASQATIVQTVLREIQSRLRYLMQVGLGYLTLDRSITSLSSGEQQRIKLATALGSPLFGTIYILDEPTIGLHPRDTEQLVSLLVDLKKQGNTVIVVEHEALVMRAADTLIEIGPKAGLHGGNLVFQGTFDALLKSDTYTASYFKGTLNLLYPTRKRSWCNRLQLDQVNLHNLQSITVTIPLKVLTVVTGVSGSGKSTLIKQVLYPALIEYFKQQSNKIIVFPFGLLRGDLDSIQGVELIQQNSLGKSSRSNPSTYLGIYDIIRDLFAKTPLAYSRCYQPGHFSFNSKKGQCSSCRGEGQQRIEMQFMADIYLPCDHCGATRFKDEITQVTYYGKNIAQILKMTVDEALCFFAHQNSIVHKLKVLQKVGLGYIQLGQSSSSLSGGEVQRLKLAYYLEKELEYSSILFIFDEPTTGLHMHDIAQFLRAIHSLVDQGHTVIVIEHHIDVIKSGDWLIDLGIDGGEKGGNVLFTGTPEDLAEQGKTHTAFYLKRNF